jgi:toxin ParE1/3/4
VPKPTLEWHAAARTDLLSIVDYISDDNPNAAQTLKDEIEEKSAKLVEHPKLYKAGRVSGTREMLVGRYIVVYAEDERRVMVLRVLHGAQLWPR